MTTRVTDPNAGQAINVPPVRRRTLIAAAALSAALAAGATLAIVNPWSAVTVGSSTSASAAAVPEQRSALPDREAFDNAIAEAVATSSASAPACDEPTHVYATAAEVPRIPH